MKDLGSLSAGLTARMNEALREEDALIGELTPPEPGEDAVAVLTAASGNAVGVVRVSHTPLDSALSLWHASTLEFLQLRCAPSAPAADIAEILDAWLARKEPEIAQAGGDRARSMRLPITARQAVIPLIERGFAPSTATLARRIPSRPPPSTGSDVRVRHAEAGDRDGMRELMRELIRTEVPFGAVRERAPELSDSYVDEALGFEPGWVLVAERDAEVIGWASITPPERSAWAAPSVRTSPAAYLGIAIVSGAARSGGVGSALVSALHAHAASAGVDTVLLDASVNNPWSMPFWQRQGYRPLWVTWQRRLPAPH